MTSNAATLERTKEATSALDALEAEGPAPTREELHKRLYLESVLTGHFLSGLGVYYRYYHLAWPVIREDMQNALYRRLCDAMVAEYISQFPDVENGGDLNPQPEDKPGVFVLTGIRDALMTQDSYGPAVALYPDDPNSETAAVDDTLIRSLVAIGLKWTSEGGITAFNAEPDAQLSEQETIAPAKSPLDEHQGGFGYKGYYKTEKWAREAEIGRRKLKGQTQ